MILDVVDLPQSLLLHIFYQHHLTLFIGLTPLLTPGVVRLKITCGCGAFSQGQVGGIHHIGRSVG